MEQCKFCDILPRRGDSIRLKRKIDNYLLEWKNSKNKMPLIIKGARQIENNTNEENENIQKNEVDATIAPEKFGQYGGTRGIILIISIISAFGIIIKRKSKKYKV